MVISGANEHDSTLHEEVWQALIRTPPDPKKVSQHICEDKAYDSREIRESLESKGYRVHIPKRGLDTEWKEGDPKYPARRWVIERTGSWHNRFRRLKIRYEVKTYNYLSFVQFANAIICFRVTTLTMSDFRLPENRVYID